MNENNFFDLPFMDTVALPILFGIFAILISLEFFFVLRTRHHPRKTRWFTNGAVAVFGLPAARFLLLPATVYLAYVCGKNGWGLLNLIEIPLWAEWILGILLLDYFIYVWHRLNHVFPLLWRFHQVHHADHDMDITTGFRFHLGEMLFSVPFRLIIVFLTGVSPMMILVYEVIFEAATLFHHSNLRLPIKVERGIAKLIITPRIHGIHHSIVQRETNSNYSTVFNFWDRLHRTARFNVPQDWIIIGLPSERDFSKDRFGNLMLMPFATIKKWRLPDGTVPKREESLPQKELPKS